MLSNRKALSDCTVRDREGQMPHEIENAGPVEATQSLRILLVEDNPDDVELCKRLLKRAFRNIHCDAVASREDFFSLLVKNAYDVILADYALGRWTGLDAFHLMRESGRDIPFILVTGALGDERAIDCIKSGIADYVLKDHPDRLPVAITRALKDRELLEKRRMAESALQESESHLRILVESIPAATFVEQGTRCCYSNRAAEQITGYSREELLNMTFWDLILPDSRKALIGLTNPHADRQPAYRYEIQILTKQGATRCLDVTVAMFENDGGLAALITAFDISERNERETAERKRLEDQVRHSHKMEALGRLCGGVAHDFNNLLGVIIGYAERLQLEIDRANPLRVGADEILGAANRAASLTRQLLAFSRPETLDRRPQDLNRVVAEIKNLLRRLIGDDIELTTILDREPLTVHADKGQLEQILMNLVVNARDAMPEGGDLVIKTTSTVVDEASIRTFPYPIPFGPYVCFSVTDTGFGMDAETKARAFDPFFSTKEKGKGTGLGLSTVYDVVKQSGGHIEILTAPGAGTTFKIFLPRFEEAVPDPVALPRATMPSDGHETVLLVEDDLSLRTSIRNTLQLAGYAVLEAKDGINALIVANKYPGAIDLLLTDLVMPGLGGWALAHELNDQRPAIRILYMSGYPEQNMEAQTAVIGSSFLAKPFTREALTRKIHEVLSACVPMKVA
jgi:two-component system cell cycle sensor histidine kinase/response regulator CckA